MEQCTLDQPGTRPFHLKADLAPSFARDNASGRTGEVEIWWASSTQWKREVRSPEFHQVEIMNDGKSWQKSEGDYFPEWLRETALELVKPVPALDRVLEQIPTGEVKRLMGQVSIDWTTVSGTAEVKNISRSYIALNESTGQLLYAGGFGWGAEFKDYSNFHGRKVARTLNVGSPQVTAKITKLEGLKTTSAGFFDATAAGSDTQPPQTVSVDEITLRKNLLPTEPIVWPPLKDGPLNGNVTTTIVVDREGKIREMSPVISENGGVNETGEQAVKAMHF